jgi:hypothetical protein
MAALAGPACSTVLQHSSAGTGPGTASPCNHAAGRQAPSAAARSAGCSKACQC